MELHGKVLVVNKEVGGIWNGFDQGHSSWEEDSYDIGILNILIVHPKGLIMKISYIYKMHFKHIHPLLLSFLTPLLHFPLLIHNSPLSLLCLPHTPPDSTYERKQVVLVFVRLVYFI
jgi:hypothetical protein